MLFIARKQSSGSEYILFMLFTFSFSL